MRDDEFMRVALETAWAGVKQGELPFGACLVREGRVVVRAHNVARRTWDITAHAETQAIREACRTLKTLDLSGLVLYATCEPCPMCFSASVWANLSRIVYGARIEDARRAGIGQIPIEASRMRQFSRWSGELAGNVLRAEGIELLKARS